MKTFLFVCGETSGDHHASRLAAELKSLDPGCRIVAMGGPGLEAAGAEVIVRYDDYAMMGFAEVISRAPRLLSLKRFLERKLAEGVDCFVPVDYPGLNLKLARFAKSRGIPVFYFISPQVWAWGAWRLVGMRRCVDLVGAILPFEKDLYRRHGIPVVFTGHPMLDEIRGRHDPKKTPEKGEPFTVLLFPGSREQELARMLPVFFDASRLIRARFPQARFTLGLAPLQREAAESRIPADMKGWMQVAENAMEELDRAALVLAVSGTITLQTAISGTPMVVCYRTGALNYLLARLLIRIPWIAMPNILAGRRIVPELIQSQARAETIAREAFRMLENPGTYESVSSDLLSIRKKLEGQGGLRRMAHALTLLAHGKSGREIEELFS